MFTYTLKSFRTVLDKVHFLSFLQPFFGHSQKVKTFQVFSFSFYSIYKPLFLLFKLFSLHLRVFIFIKKVKGKVVNQSGLTPETFGLKLVLSSSSSALSFVCTNYSMNYIQLLINDNNV